MTPHAQGTDAGDLTDALHALWDLSVDMLFVADERGHLTRVSPSWALHLGYPTDELLGTPYLSLVHPDDVTRTLAQTSALTQPGSTPVSFENRCRAKDGSYHWLAWSCRRSDDDPSIYGVVRDVTETRETEESYLGLVERLEERELMLSSVIEHNLSAISIKDLTGRYLVYNQKFAEVFDLEQRGALEGKSPYRVLLGRDDSWLDPDLAPFWRENDRRAALESHSVTEWSDHPTRGRLTFDTLKFPLLNTAGEVYATCGVCLDVTEHVRLVAQHREAEELFRGAFEHSPIGKALVDRDGRLMRANGALVRITGRDTEDLTGQSLSQVLSPEYAEQVAALGALPQTEVVRAELEIQGCDGESVWIAASSSAVRGPEDSILYFVVQVQDITARIRADEAQRSSEARFRTLFTHAAVGVIEALPDGTIAAANPRVCELLGYEAEELVGRPASFIAEPSDQALQTQQIAAVADGGGGYATPRHYLRKDGSAIPVLVSVGVVYDDEGVVDRLVGTIIDMTPQFEAEEALRSANAEIHQRQAFMEAVLESVDTGVLACDASSNVVLRNMAQRKLFGIGQAESPSREELSRRVRVVGDDGQEISLIDSPLMQALSGNERSGVPMRICGIAGTADAEIRVTTRQIRDEDGTVLGAVAAFTDVTVEHQIQEQLRDGAAFHDAVLAATPDLIYVSDPRTHRNLWASRSVFDILGYTEAQMQELGEGLVERLVHPEDIDRAVATNMASQRLADGEVLELRYRVRHAAGDYRWLARRITPFARDRTGQVTHVLGVARDISEIVDVEQRLSEAALHDPLTGLPNRTLLADRLGIALSRSARTGQEIAVLFCDLDGFKRVNDTAGHAAGDAVLRTTARRLVAALRVEDTVARVGGDEFAIILQPSRDPKGGEADEYEPFDVRAHAEQAAARLREAVREPIEVADGSHVVSASIGIKFANASSDPGDILRDADTAMYRAKTRGRDRAEIFDGALRTHAAERGRVERVLRATISALADDRAQLLTSGRARAHSNRGGRLSVAYQPIIDLATMNLVGVEALARLVDEYGLAIPPDDFIPVAEETGMIGALGRHILEVACTDLAHWRREHPARRDLGVAVNLSARQAGLVDLNDQVRNALSRTGLAPHLLTLELTESVLLDAGRSTMSAITALSETGVRISIDDFGTGYASLRYLATLPVSSVKVDRSFTSGITDNPTSASIVRAITGLARDLHLGCVVEGIEDAAQLAALPRGVHGQGYLLGRPVPAHDIATLLCTSVAS